MNIIDHLKNNVEKYPTKIGFIDEENEFTFQEMYEQVTKFSSAISLIYQKEVVSLVSENSLKFIIAYLGIINSGKIVHLIPPHLSRKNFVEQIISSKSQIIICQDNCKNDFIDYVPQLPILEFNEVFSQSVKDDIPTKINDIAYLIYTSGTTAEPKGVPISQEMVEFTTNNIIKVLGYSNTDVDVIPLPLHHSFGLGCLHTSIHVGSTVVLLKNVNNLDHVLESIKKFNATTFAAVPATLTKILKFNKNMLNGYFSNLRLIITNSTQIPKNTVIELKKILTKGNLATYYGLTEASRSTFMIFDENSNREESVGKTSPGVLIKIIKNNDDSEFGEILIQGKNVIKNYWKNPMADKNLEDGWLHTGDIGYFDEENYLFLKGRSDDVINIGGEKVIPYEIEEIVKQISEVDDAVAFGIENEIFGHTIKLNVLKKDNSELDKSKILSHCLKNLEKFKIPSKIEFVDKIPKNEYGKVKRYMLK
jgi:long-chain acyl-CoA synthetase